jgi:hypothetical protein
MNDLSSSSSGRPGVNGRPSGRADVIGHTSAGSRA